MEGMIGHDMEPWLSKSMELHAATPKMGMEVSLGQGGWGPIILWAVPPSSLLFSHGAFLGVFGYCACHWGC